MNTPKPIPALKIYFSDFFDVDKEKLEEYGAFNISLINDLPLFIDPFLLFNSENARYKELHNEIIDYVVFLKSISKNQLDAGLIKSLFTFHEVKQNWLGYSKNGNKGRGLGPKFAKALNINLSTIFKDFGEEEIAESSHFEKLSLIDTGIGRDSVSDFTTNLIKKFLIEYTESFAVKNISPSKLKRHAVNKIKFNKFTKTWSSGSYMLPTYNNDFVLLTPKNILTKDNAWINRPDMLNDFSDIIESIPNEQLRAHINEYFYSILPRDEVPTKEEEQTALTRTIQKHPELLDYFIRLKESRGDLAQSVSDERVKAVETIFVEQLSKLASILTTKTEFYNTDQDTYEESLKRVIFLKHVIEDNDGYRLFYYKGEHIQRESDLQLIFKLTWFATPLDVNAEVNNGRGPVDFKISNGSKDKTLVEFKLASNTKLKQNLEKQVEIYAQANQTDKTIKAILFFTESQHARVIEILKDLNLNNEPSIILIDARNDNKPSASNAK